MTRGAPVKAVTLDFFNTLVFCRSEGGRGRALMEYLGAQGFRPAPWEHQVLYDVFEAHDRDYSPSASRQEKSRYHIDLAARVLERLRIPASAEEAERHAQPIWEIMGPSALDRFSDVLDTLRALRESALPLAMISNWQCGLRHFCEELGLSGFFDHVLGSADLGVAKPDPRIFHDACERLGVMPENVLHVGDSFADDYAGAESAGLQVTLLARDGNGDPRATEVLRELAELPGWVALTRR